MSYRVMLAKILPQKFLDDFLDGNLHLNSDAFFAQAEADGFLRSDPYEGADDAIQFKEIAIKIGDGKWVPIGGSKSPLIYRHGNKQSRNILCLYMFTNKHDFEFDKRNMNFGEVAVVITDLKEFIKRIRNASIKEGNELYQAPVEYIDKKVHHGKMGPFRKFSEYGYQSEFRFVLVTSNAEPEQAIKLPIGDIRDIAIVCTSDKLSELPTKVEMN
jgi:hypothetical protein